MAKTWKEIVTAFKGAMINEHGSVILIGAPMTTTMLEGHSFIDFRKPLQFTRASFDATDRAGFVRPVWIVTPGEFVKCRNRAEWDEATPAEQFCFEPPDADWTYSKAEGWIHQSAQSRYNLKTEAAEKLKQESTHARQRREFEKELELLGI